MIRLNDFEIHPTLFPDGTSQVWKLPRELLNQPKYNVTWHFEFEEELFYLFSLQELLGSPVWTLYVPYLPYARQDKDVSNDTTFNLCVFSKLLNQLNFQVVTSIDVHNPSYTGALIDNFKNIQAHFWQDTVIAQLQPEVIVYPDAGAMKRYAGSIAEKDLPVFVFEKDRDQETGKIKGFKLKKFDYVPKTTRKFLIIDDICDGGATFIGVAQSLRQFFPHASIALFTTHGIYSQGRQHLHGKDIDTYTTDSLIKNKGQRGIFHV